MGSGKTSVGRLLAKTLVIDFIDLDEYIEKKEGNTITEIFEKSGENGFREIEHAYLLELLALTKRTVISLGGGTVCFFNTVELIKEKGLLVYLKTDVDALYQRLNKESDTRPMLQKSKGNTLRDLIKNKLVEREPYYLQADLIVDSSQNTEEVAGQIEKWLK